MDDADSAIKTDEQQTSSPSMPLLSRYHQAIEAISGESPHDALLSLLDLRSQVIALGLVSKNESLLDIQTSNLPFVSIQYHIAMAHLASSSLHVHNRFEKRHENLHRAVELFHNFLRQMEDIMACSEGEEGERLYRSNNIRSDYHALLDKVDDEDNCDDQATDWMRAAESSRDDKIARLKRRRKLENDIEGFTCSVNATAPKSFHKKNDEIQDDGESIRRELFTKQLILYCILSIEELLACQKEMEMLKMAVQMERQKQQQEVRMQTATISSRTSQTAQNTNSDARGRHTSSQHEAHAKAPMELTHISQDPFTGKLIIKKEQIKSNVFRPSWNLPTVTLAELGDHERMAAIERSQQQKLVEEGQHLQPKRYDQLVADGLEDDLGLVDASAALDRTWDDFKYENPRGCGNKMGDRGDRNF